MQSLISLGSNIGSLFSNIETAKKYISEKNKILRVSKLMKTSPIGYENQNYFLNQIALIETKLNPFELLGFFKDIEIQIGRIKRPRWTQREIDIDIITYENLIINSDKLTIPHKELSNRLFVLLGASQVMQNYQVPIFNQTFLNIYENKKDILKDQKLEYL